MSDTSNTRRRGRKTADEYDVFAKRGYYAEKAWRAGVKKYTKVKANRRLRREARIEVRSDD